MLIAALELRDKIFGGRERSPEFILRGSHSLVRHRTSKVRKLSVSGSLKSVTIIREKCTENRPGCLSPDTNDYVVTSIC